MTHMKKVAEIVQKLVYTAEQLHAHLVAENSNSINESLASIIAGRRR